MNTQKLKIKSAYSKREPSLTNHKKFKPSLAVQEQKESTDINNILDRFQREGLITHVNNNEAQYGDFVGYDFQKAKNEVTKIQSSFNELPASVRQQFDNDPQQWIEHIAIPDNVEDMKDGVIDNEIDLEDKENTKEEATNTSSKTDVKE